MDSAEPSPVNGLPARGSKTSTYQKWRHWASVRGPRKLSQDYRVYAWSVCSTSLVQLRSSLPTQALADESLWLMPCESYCLFAEVQVTL